MKPSVQSPAIPVLARLCKEVLALVLLCFLAALSETGISQSISLPGPTWDNLNITTTLLSGSSLFKSLRHDFQQGAWEASIQDLSDSLMVSG